MKISIKSFFRPLAAIITIMAILLASAPASFAQNAANPSLHQPGYYRMQIGEVEVTALSDGTFPLDAAKLLTNTKPGEIDQLLAASYLKNPIENSVNAYLVKTRDKLILIDAGTADAFGPSLGMLTKSLQAAGYSPEQIDAVLITHIHPDHIGGLMEGDKMVFPNATVYISRPEAAFWLTDESRNKAPEGLKFYFENAAQKVGPYQKAGKLKTYDYTGELFPGITPIASPGHTPGHSFYALESKGQKLLFWGDVVHVASVQLTDPSVTIQYDVDPKAAAIQRKKAFSDAAKKRYWIACDHLSFPGIGHLRADGAKYIYMPANYSAFATGQ